MHDNTRILQDNNTILSMMNMPGLDGYVPGIDPTYDLGATPVRTPVAEPMSMMPHSWPEELPEPYILTHL